MIFYVFPPGLKQIRGPCRVPAVPMSTGGTGAGGGGGGGRENMMYFLLVGAVAVGGGVYVSHVTPLSSRKENVAHLCYSPVYPQSPGHQHFRHGIES